MSLPHRINRLGHQQHPFYERFPCRCRHTGIQAYTLLAVATPPPPAKFRYGFYPHLLSIYTIWGGGAAQNLENYNEDNLWLEKIEIVTVILRRN